jgi:transglutaminase-like putative cysteine protease
MTLCALLRVGACALVAAVLAAPAPSDEPAEGVTRWYEVLRAGKKVGWTKVTWTPATVAGAPGVHDRTEQVTRSARDMAGHIDVFETRTVIDLDRGEDGTLFSQKVEVHEAGRVTVETLAWDGKAYVHKATVDGHAQVTTVPLDAPVMTDAEAFLVQRAKAGTLEPGQGFDLRELDVVGRRARTNRVEVIAREEVEGEAGPVAATKVVVRHPETRSETWMWLDGEGAFVRSASDTGYVVQRVSAERARVFTGRVPAFSITSRSFPPLDRVMSADRLWVEVAIEDDPERKLPEFPASPWGKVGAPRRDEDRGWVYEAELWRHDVPGRTTPWPIPPAGFEKDLEPTALMPAQHPRLVEAAKEAVGDARDARTAAHRLARYVYEKLEKRSLDVAQGGALEILEACRGDCSEHGLLYVALCRAAGLPARRCTGWVNIGSDWGAHAWAEVWVGAWVAADPTTGEVAPAARYLFFGYSDDPDSYPGVVSARVDGRISLRCTRIEEDGVQFDLDPDDPRQTITASEPEPWFLHVASGIELRGLPEGWTAQAVRGAVVVRGPGVVASIDASPDQGSDGESIGRVGNTFAGRPAFVVGEEKQRMITMHARRRFLQVQLRVTDEAQVALFEKAFAPTVAEVVTRPDRAVAPAEGPALLGAWEVDREATLAAQLTASLEGLPEEVRARMAPRIERLLGRLSLDLVIGADGTWSYTFVRPFDETGSSREEAKGAWKAVPEGIDLQQPPNAQLVRGPLTSAAGDRLAMRVGVWWLVLKRAGAESPR